MLSGFPATPGEVALEVERQGADFELKLTAKRDAKAKVPGEMTLGQMSTGRMPTGRMSRETDVAERAREKYRQLKKLMQKDYKQLCRAGEEGHMPDPEALESFLALCGSMAETVQPVLPAHGAEAPELARANRAFVEDAQDLRRAASARDPRAMEKRRGSRLCWISAAASRSLRWRSCLRSRSSFCFSNRVTSWMLRIRSPLGMWPECLASGSVCRASWTVTGIRPWN